MSVLQWRPSRPQARALSISPTPGAYAGRARFRPRKLNRVPDVLKGAVGRVIEFGFAGIADAAAPFAGQRLYLEWRTDEVLDGFLIPEEDLEFVNDAASQNG